MKIIFYLLGLIFTLDGLRGIHFVAFGDGKFFTLFEKALSLSVLGLPLGIFCLSAGHYTQQFGAKVPSWQLGIILLLHAINAVAWNSIIGLPTRFGGAIIAVIFAGYNFSACRR